MRDARKAAGTATKVAVLAMTLMGSWVATAQAIDSPGGTPGPVAEVATRGTGGTVYTAAPPQSHATSKSPSRKQAKPAKPVKPVPKAPAKPTPGVPTPAQTAAEAAVFPVLGAHSFGNAENRFGAGRTGHIHEGQDVLASEGLQVVAPLAGTIITTAYQAGGAGWYAAEHTVDGLDFFYAHCQASSLAVSAGETVSAGQAICGVGQTGDATGPHLHFEVWIGGWQAKGGYPIDPLPYLEAWEAPAAG